MEKLISLAQVEQLIDEASNNMEDIKRDYPNSTYTKASIEMVQLAYKELKSKLSSLPTEESGWIAVKDIEMLQRYNHWYEYDVTDMVESDTWEYVRYESLKLLPKSPLQ